MNRMYAIVADLGTYEKYVDFTNRQLTEDLVLSPDKSMVEYELEEWRVYSSKISFRIKEFLVEEDPE